MMRALLFTGGAMPVVKAFVPPSLLTLAPAGLDAFGDAVGAICLDVLRASPRQIQVMVVPAHTPRGEPIYVEVNFRGNAFRDADVVARFMSDLEGVVQDTFHTVPRIRCFSEDQASLHARN
jgi:hypothetical protein